MFDYHYAKYYDTLYQDKPYKDEIKFVYKLAEKPKTILDLGCGRADYWCHFPDDVEITGVEQSRAMIDLSPYKEKIIKTDLRKIHEFVFGEGFDAVVGLFNVVNYTRRLSWMDRLPIKLGGYLIFDVWDMNRIKQDGFSTTVKELPGIKRTITPKECSVGYPHVILDIKTETPEETFTEKHTMFLHSYPRILAACGEKYKLIVMIQTDTWNRWYKLQKIG